MTAEQLTAVGPEDRYRLEHRIATGGMGVVWQATDTLLDREVAVKVLKSEYADDPTFRSRFEAEARHAAALHHPHVASVFDFGETPAAGGSDASCPFLVMELVPGRPLSALLHGDRPMEPDVAAELVAQAAEAIAAAHALGIVHRDVKPGNLLVSPDGDVKITDFGIARAGDAVALTQTGQIVGTPHYISPEQAEGRTATEASDVYALGVVLYECLAGRRPFVGDTPVTIALAHLREAPPPLPDDIPLHLRQVTAKALAKDPADRFDSADDLARAVRGGPIEGPLPSETQLFPAATSAVRRTRRSPAFAVAAAAAGAVLLVIVLGLGTGDSPEEAAAEADDTAVPTGAAPSETTEPVRVRRAKLVGKDADRVVRRLETRGLEVDREAQANPGGHRPGTVAAVTPHGRVAPSTTITLFVWDKPERRPVGSEDSGTSGTSGDGGVAPGPPPPGGESHKGPSDRGEQASGGKAGNGKGNTR